MGFKNVHFCGTGERRPGSPSVPEAGQSRSLPLLAGGESCGGPWGWPLTISSPPSAVPLSVKGSPSLPTLQNQRRCLAILALRLPLKSRSFHVPLDTFALFLEMAKVSWSDSLTAIGHIFQTKTWNMWSGMRTSGRCYLVARILRVSGKLFRSIKLKGKKYETETNLQEEQPAPPPALPWGNTGAGGEGLSSFSCGVWAWLWLVPGCPQLQALCQGGSCGWVSSKCNARVQAGGWAVPPGCFPALGPKGWDSLGGDGRVSLLNY